MPRIVVALALAATPLAAQQETLPVGSRVPIRFVEAVKSGRDKVGTTVILQSMAAVRKDTCVMLAPFRTVYASVSSSRGGRLFGRQADLAIQVDSIRRQSGHVLKMSAVLDSLEWLPGGGRITASGTVVQRGRGMVSKALLPAAAATGGLALVPVALIGGFSLARKGPSLDIVAGELGLVRLTEPLVIPDPASCHKAGAETLVLPKLPRFTPRVTDKSGMVLGDEVNIVILGTRHEVASAFFAAGWQFEAERSMMNLFRGSAAVVFKGTDTRVPFSPEYYEGRVQDLGFQRTGINARLRHHIRLWQLDSDSTVWIGAANEDIGFKFDPLTLSATHRMDPDIDSERDVVTGDLQAGGCAQFLGLVELPGAVTSGRNTSNQPFYTDGKAALLRADACASNEAQN